MKQPFSVCAVDAAGHFPDSRIGASLKRVRENP